MCPNDSLWELEEIVGWATKEHLSAWQRCQRLANGFTPREIVSVVLATAVLTECRRGRKAGAGRHHRSLHGD